MHQIESHRKVIKQQNSEINLILINLEEDSDIDESSPDIEYFFLLYGAF